MKRPTGLEGLCAFASVTAFFACTETASMRADAPKGIQDAATGDAIRSPLDAKPEAPGDPDEGNPFSGTLTPVQRGEYLVRHVAGCAECHTPTGLFERIDEARLLSGVENFLDLSPLDAATGMLHTPNLTPDEETGLGLWSNDEIRGAFLDGFSRDGTPLHPTMPYFVFHNMTSRDADAIVAFLRSIPPVNHAVPPRQQLPVPLLEPAQPIPPERIPTTTLSRDDPNYERAVSGRYLAGEIGFCMYCHTETLLPNAAFAIDVDKLFMGRRKLHPYVLGTPFPQNETIYPLLESKNLTPQSSGIADYTPETVVRALKEGVDPSNEALGIRLCAPMPAGPDRAFGGMLYRDALDIGYYLTSIAPRDNGPVEECCTSCHRQIGFGSFDGGP